MHWSAENGGGRPAATIARSVLVEDLRSAALAEVGLVLRVNGRWEMPREAGVAAWLAERELPLTGRPDIPRVAVAAASMLTTAQAAVQDLLRTVTALAGRRQARGCGGA